MLQTVSNISNYAINNNVNWTAPIKRATITDFTNPLFPRNILISSNGIQVSRPDGAVGIAIADLITLVVAVNPALTWPPRFTVMPANQTAQYGGTASFTATVNSELAATYQWQKSPDGITWSNATGGVYSGDTTTTLSISDTSGLNNYQYRLVATNSLGTTNSIAGVLTVIDPGITAQPANLSAPYGGTASFAITAHGASSLTYDWQVSTNGGVSWANASGGVYSGNTTNTLSISSTNGLNTYQYRCIVTDTAGSQTSHIAILTVVDPGITVQPSNQSVTHPAGASFSVTAFGATSLTYNWQVSTDGGVTWGNASGGVYSGNTTATLTLASTTLGMNGYKYRVQVTDVASTQTSTVATLTVT